jgi:hypothetical protein
LARDNTRDRRETVGVALRPSFSVDLPLPSREAIGGLSAQLAAGAQQLRRTRVPGGGGDSATRDRDHLVLTVPESRQRVWSPWLTIDLSPSDAGTHLFARFSPHPSVWTGFAFGYLTVSVGLVLSLVFAGAQAMVGGDLWPLMISAAAVLVLGAMWWTARLGQRLAQAQMSALRDELDRAVAACLAAR